MASKKLLQMYTRGLPKVTKKWYSVSSMAVPLSEAPSSYVPETPANRVPTIGPVQVTKLANGITVATRDTPFPYSNIGVFIKSGSRSEAYHQKGLTRALANSAFLSTVDKTAYVMNKELDYVGVNFNCSNTREFIVYNASLQKGAEDFVMSRFGSFISSPALHHWEVLDDIPRFAVQRNNASPETVVMEELHKYSFRSGLSNTLFCPSFNEMNMTSDTMREFIKSWYTCQNTIVVGLGVDHSSLVQLTGSSLSLPELLPRTLPKAEYIGGGEVRIEALSDSTHVAISCKGASFTGDSKELYSSGVLQHILGAKEYVKWGSGSAASRLNKAVATKVDTPFQIKSFNLNYSDNGLFGLYAVANGNDITQVMKNAMTEFTEVAKGNFTEQDLTRAKQQLKAALYNNADTQSCDALNIAQQVAFTGSYQPFNESMIDSITAQDVTKFAKRVFAARPNFVAYGNLSNLPRMDELLPGISVK